MRTLIAIFACAISISVASARVELVSQADGAAVFARIEASMKTVLQLKSGIPAPSWAKGTMTRGQILERFSTIVNAAQSKFKVTPPKLPTVPGYVTLKAPKHKVLAEKLASMGFVDKVGPLLTSKTEGLTAQQFGDALGYFMSRMAELTHLPSSRFTPALMPPG